MTGDATAWPVTITEAQAIGVFLSGQVSGIASYMATIAANGSAAAAGYTPEQIQESAQALARDFAESFADRIRTDPAVRAELLDHLAAGLTTGGPTEAVWL